MAGFLDAETTVIDMVFTDQGKRALMAGDLTFTFWIPFDDEVDYSPPSPQPRADQTVAQRAQELTESPLVREATMGYRGLNFAEEDTTNLHRPMFSAPSGMGQTMALPQLVLNRPAASGNIKPLGVSVSQKKLSKIYVQKDPAGVVILKQVGPVLAGFQRLNSTEEVLDVGYSTGSFPADYQSEGFLVTMFVSSALKTDELGQVQGGFQEVVHNRDSVGNIAYRNDIKLNVYTP